MKCVTRSEAVQRYGPIDFANHRWAREGEWIIDFNVRTFGFDHWKVMDTQQICTHIRCNKDLVAPLTGALTLVKQKNLGHLLKTFDGCFNIRTVRGSSLISTHAYGLALDLNAADNPLGVVHGGFYNEQDFVKCFTDQGFAWGGNFRGRKDSMHFSYAWEG